MTYRIIHDSIWRDRWFAGLTTEPRLVYLWALTCPGVSRAGIVAFLEGAAAVELGLSTKAFLAALAACDPKLRLVENQIVIANWGRYQHANPKDALGAARVAARYSPAIRAAWLEANEEEFARRGWDGADEVRRSLLDVDADLLATVRDPAVADPARPSRENKIAARLREDREAIDAIFDYWRERTASRDAPLTRDRLATIRARLREGMTLEQAKQAIDGCVKRGPIDGKLFNGIDIIFRNADKVRMYAGMANGAAIAATSPHAVVESQPCEVCGTPVAGARIHTLCRSSAPRLAPTGLQRIDATMGDIVKAP